MKTTLISAAVVVMLAVPARAQSLSCADVYESLRSAAAALPAFAQVQLDPDISRLLHYSAIETRHRLAGLASYYSNSLDGTLTANGERYRKHRFTAAHLTLPLGCWVEVTSCATGRKVRLRVNDRGPYVKKFCIDLSRAAAHALGVDRAEDRRVMIRIIAMPGDDPLPEAVLEGPETAIAAELASGR